MTVLALRAAARAAKHLGDARERAALDAIDWLVPQSQFLALPYRWKMLRAGNQTVGKTTVGLAECIMHALGTHPVHPWRGPRIVWIVTASWSQSLAIQQKLWALLPKQHITDRCRNGYSPKHGFGNHNPMAEFTNGSIIQIKTAKQDALDLASATVHHVLFDEPPKYQRVFEEIKKRLAVTNGTMSLTLTPINAPVDYLREQTEAGLIHDMHVRLTSEIQRHTRSGRRRILPDGTPADEAWIERLRRETPSHEAPVTMDGEWETRSVGRVFGAFQPIIAPQGHIFTDATRRPDEARVLLGIDHGQTSGTQAIMLVEVEITTDPHPSVWVLDEYCPSAATTSEQDADAVLGMLRRAGLGWSDVDEIWGDIPSGTGRLDPARKGNLDLEDAIARRLGKRTRDALTPRIKTAKRGRDAGSGSVRLGIRYLHQQMVRQRFFVHQRCTTLINGLSNWQGRRGDKKDEGHKHPIDGVRYALRTYVTGQHQTGYATPALRTR